MHPKGANLDEGAGPHPKWARADIRRIVNAATVTRISGDRDYLKVTVFLGCSSTLRENTSGRA